MGKSDILKEEEKKIIKSNKTCSLPSNFKKVVRGVATIFTAAIILVSAVSCGNETTNTPPTQPPTQIEQPSSPVTPTIPTERVEAFIDSLKDNYSYVVTDNGQTYRYLIDGNAIKTYEGEDIRGSFYFTEGDTAYTLTYDKSEGMWDKNFATETIDLSTIIYNKLSDMEIIGYDEETEIFTAQLDSKSYLLEIYSQGLVVKSDNYYGEIYDVGKTKVELPDASKIVDNTVQVDPPIVVDPPVEEENKIWSEEKGYAYNIPLLTKTIENWIKENNAEEFCFAAGGELQKIIFMEVQEDNTLQFQAIAEYNGKTYFAPIKTRNALSAKLKEGSLTTVEELVEYMNQDGRNFNNNGPSIECEYTTLDYTADQKAEFDTLTTNVLNRVATKGIQPTSINNPYQDAVPEFANAEVLFGFKTPAGAETAGADLGYGKGWEQYYVLKTDNGLEFLKIYIVSSTTNAVENEKENVLNDVTNWWLISGIERKEINEDNLKLFEEENVEEASVAMSKAVFHTNKEKNLEL